MQKKLLRKIKPVFRDLFPVPVLFFVRIVLWQFTYTYSTLILYIEIVSKKRVIK